MKRDLELVRLLMLEIESKDDRFDHTKLAIDGYDLSQIDYHLQLLIEAQFVIGRVIKNFGGSIIKVEKLSWEGCNFLDDARNESVWKKTMATVKEKGGSVSFAVLTQLLISAAKQHFGLG
jgi:Hypothetical protein (DUF2513)